MIIIDGSRGEGGGALLRQALGLSIYTGKPFKMVNVRASRPSPGLKMQHLQALNAAQRLSNAEVQGNFIGCKEVYFSPGELCEKNLKIDIGTAGSVTLLFQSVLLPLVFSDKHFKVEVRGGTDVAWSPPIDYFSNVLTPQLRRFREVDVELLRRGYYPKGGGKAVLSLRGSFKEKPLTFPASQLLCFKGVSHASKDLEQARVSERQERTASLILEGLAPVSITREYANTLSTGSGVTLWALKGSDEGLDFDNPCVLGSSALGEKGRRAELVGEEAALSLREEALSGADVDRHLADQLLPFLGVVGGSFKASALTRHFHSTLYVAELFLGKRFKVDCLTVSAKPYQ